MHEPANVWLLWIFGAVLLPSTFCILWLGLGQALNKGPASAGITWIARLILDPNTIGPLALSVLSLAALVDVIAELKNWFRNRGFYN